MLVGVAGRFFLGPVDGSGDLSTPVYHQHSFEKRREVHPSMALWVYGMVDHIVWYPNVFSARLLINGVRFSEVTGVPPLWLGLGYRDRVISSSHRFDSSSSSPFSPYSSFACHRWRRLCLEPTPVCVCLRSVFFQYPPWVRCQIESS